MSQAPIARKVAHSNVYHGTTYEDPYHWLRDKKNPDVIAHLTAENEYTKNVHINSNAAIAKSVYNEFVAHLNEDDETVKVRRGDYLYYSQTKKGLNYPIYLRQAKDNSISVLLDQNLDKDAKYQDVGFLAMSPDHRILAYSMDYEGNEIYTAYFKDMATGKIIGSFENASSDACWSNDGKALYYTVLDSILRPYKVMRYNLDTKQHEQIFEEPDEKYTVAIEKTTSNDFIVITTRSSLTVESWIIDAHSCTASPKIFQARVVGLKYYIEHQGNRWYIVSNHVKEFVNFRLFVCDLNATKKDDWKPVMDYNPKVHITGVDTLKDYVILYERCNAVKSVRVLDKDHKEIKLEHPDPYFSVFGASTSKYYYDNNIFRYVYTTRLTPRQYWELDLKTGKKDLLKETFVPSYDKTLYAETRIHVPIPADSQVKIENVDMPNEIAVTILYRKDKFKQDGKNPCLLYGYGSYGISLDSDMSSRILSYLDRGIVYAVAHIRGGGDCGRGWYESGKFLHKRNTFSDFVAVSDAIVQQKFTSRDKLAIEGRSAGGLLIGASLNFRPDMSKCAIAGVPFVDVINTMMDPTIPLTVGEYEEWGNPNEIEYFNYMLSYSPYDQLSKEGKFPNLLVKAGLNDPRVQYWEPAKWVAKLREYKKCDLLVFDCKMGSGHFGTSGRYGYLEEAAADYAFVISQIGVRD